MSFERPNAEQHGRIPEGSLHNAQHRPSKYSEILRRRPAERRGQSDARYGAGAVTFASRMP